MIICLLRRVKRLVNKFQSYLAYLPIHGWWFQPHWSILVNQPSIPNLGVNKEREKNTNKIQNSYRFNNQFPLLETQVKQARWYNRSLVGNFHNKLHCTWLCVCCGWAGALVITKSCDTPTDRAINTGISVLDGLVLIGRVNKHQQNSSTTTRYP